MSFENLIVHKEDGICTITINREDKLNALNRGMIQEIGKAISDAEADSEVRCIIISGAGKKAFIAGADIAEFSKYSVEEAKQLSSDGHRVFNSIESCSKPVIAAINGFALGGGCELAMSCHIRIASDNARFGQPEVKLGLIPGYGGTQRLPALIGKSKAMELLLCGDMISAIEALQWGLVSAVYTQDELLPKANELASKFVAMAPLAMKEIIHCALENSIENGLKEEINAFSRCFNTDDMKEGVDAFLNKRPAVFNGK
ncbi:MAG TPA: enoyl-CoA hydratase-related protein [Bacteroidia bacterium]|nr:enoyl-CoA hydratase-related protein [Bacteroidia bacterium]HNT79520.1 enoyl-CoA hydratase-related protein [Bacteroidia bacterium]